MSADCGGRDGKDVQLVESEACFLVFVEFLEELGVRLVEKIGVLCSCFVSHPDGRVGDVRWLVGVLVKVPHAWVGELAAHQEV